MMDQIYSFRLWVFRTPMRVTKMKISHSEDDIAIEKGLRMMESQPFVMLSLFAFLLENLNFYDGCTCS